jgi:DNA-binding beta-propeller fold protein YncE
MMTFGTVGGIMEKMTSRLAAAVVVAGVAVLGAGCAANAAPPAGGHPSPAPAASSGLPNPFKIMAGYSAKSLGLDHPDAFAAGPDGNLYVTDLSQRVTVISPGGKVLRRWGKAGTRPGEFKFIASDLATPTDVAGKIAVGGNGMVYVSDSGNGRVQVFTPQGRFIRQIGSYGSGKGQFFFPAGLAVDGSGNVYVADDQSRTLAKFSPTGNVIWRIGASTSSDQDLVGHQQLASIDAHGRLVTMNDDEGRVLYVDPNGHKVDAFSPDSSFFFEGNMCEVTVDAAGNTYVSACGAKPPAPTLVYNRAHRLIAQWPGSKYPLQTSPVFGPSGEGFALAWDGSILRLRITLPAG